MQEDKDRFFKDGKFEVRDSPVKWGDCSSGDQLKAAGYQKLCSFGPGSNGYGFGLSIERHTDGERHAATIDYGDTFDLIFIDTFADYMEFMRQFGHLGIIGEASDTGYYVKAAHDLALDAESGILREQVQDVHREQRRLRDLRKQRVPTQQKS